MYDLVLSVLGLPSNMLGGNAAFAITIVFTLASFGGLLLLLVSILKIFGRR